MTNEEKAIAEGCYYDEAQADRAIRFMETYVCVSTTGRTLRLLDWQRDLVSQLYGFRNKAGGKRYKRVILSMAKKNGGLPPR